MMASGTVKLTEGEAGSVELTMERKVMQLQQVTIKDVPAGSTAVSVSISPLFESLYINGSYSSTTTSHQVTLAQLAGTQTWQNSATEYLLPTNGKATIAVTITLASGTDKTFTYTCEALEANRKVDIEGIYTPEGVQLTGTFVGVQWGDDQKISFRFNDSGSSENNGGEGGGGGDNPTPGGGSDEPLTSIPKVGDTYKGCYVLVVEDETATSATLTLVSPNEKNGILSEKMTANTDEKVAEVLAKINAELPSLSVAGIDGWRIMNDDEAKAFFEHKADIVGTISGTKCYLFQTPYYIYSFDVSKRSFDLVTEIDQNSYLRPVAKVQVTIE